MQHPKINSALEMHVKTHRSNRSKGAQSGAYPRLTQPLVRDGDVLRPASWDEALDRAAEGFIRNLRNNGRTATGIFSCSKSTNEVNFLASKMARQVFGNNNVDSCNRT
jgi:formate dehydrogenase major subunit